VTVFHRGDTEPAGLPAVEHIHGDRNANLGKLAGRTWDAALDFCAYLPRQVRAAAEVLRGSVGHCSLISTLAVLNKDGPPGANEDTTLVEPMDDEEVSEETYGPLKLACELEARGAFGEACLIVRPGYVVGPNDPTDRFTSWIRRAAQGGEMLAPGPPDAPMQFIDARDLAIFTLGRAEVADGGTYGVVRPPGEATTSRVLEAAINAAGADTKLTWVDQDFLLDALGTDVGTALPMWHPWRVGSMLYDSSRAVTAGLRPRPLAETVADTLAWDRTCPQGPLQAGLSPDRERALLTSWRLRGATG
jgi:2'-hydroxyisoflavone reductase